jgi:SAM-dependent methyltransferase
MTQTTEGRAIATGGASNDAVHALVVRALETYGTAGGVIVDVGAGRGDLGRLLRGRFTRYVGADVVRHAGFPGDLEFVTTDLDTHRVPLPDGAADVVACVETIEHVENPRALMRELVRLARPGGLVIVTTPNQLSLASTLCLLVRGQFSQFQEGPGLYPAHITALLEVDLRRIAAEAGLEGVDVLYSARGRLPLSPHPWPRWLAAPNGWRGRAFSDNVLVAGRKPQPKIPS